MKFENSDDVNEYFSEWPDFTEAERLRAIRDLRFHGQLTLMKKPCSIAHHCPLHNFPVARPCSISKCSFYVDNANQKNCLFYSLSRSKAGKLTTSEAAAVLKTSVATVNSATQKATLAIRRAMIADKLEKAVVYSRFVHLQGHCVHCGTYIQPELDMSDESVEPIDNGLYGWCSRECKEALPYWAFSLQREFKADHVMVLAIAYAALRKSTLVDETLSLEKGTTNNYREAIEDLLEHL